MPRKPLLINDSNLFMDLRRTDLLDLMASVLAQQECCPLLTGDQHLRKAATAEAVEVRGTIWLLEYMLDHGLITTAVAQGGYAAMEDAGRRLPFAAAGARLGQR